MTTGSRVARERAGGDASGNRGARMMKVRGEPALDPRLPPRRETIIAGIAPSARVSHRPISLASLTPAHLPRSPQAGSSLETFYADNEDLVGSLNVSFRDGAGEARDEAAYEGALHEILGDGGGSRRDGGRWRTRSSRA